MNVPCQVLRINLKNQSMKNKLWRFHGGLHLSEHKTLSSEQPLKDALDPDIFVIPLNQHIGEAAKPLVKIHDQVFKGQLIASAPSAISANIHAPISGSILNITAHPVSHPAVKTTVCILIKNDRQEQWADLPPPLALNADPQSIIERIRWAGIVGLGGATFPTDIKVAGANQQRIKTLIINGAECEPYITCDDILMRVNAEQIIQGIQILQHLLQPEKCLIGIEDNKPAAIESLTAEIKQQQAQNIEIKVIPTRYPSGGEKQLIRILTGISLRGNQLPADKQMICQNVATVAHIADAVLNGKPLISRIITLSGDSFKKPQNFCAKIGILYTDLIKQAGGYIDNKPPQQLILGGPMMGLPLSQDDTPLTKGSNSLLALSAAQTPAYTEIPCIRCGYCVSVCPVQLLPQELYWHSKAKNFERAEGLNLFDCIECGCCSHVCPSHIPLVDYYRFSKSQIKNQKTKKQKSDVARLRHEAREARLERLAAERKARLRKKKEMLDNKKTDKTDPKKAAIAAALARVAAKKAEKKSTEDNHQGSKK